MMRSHMLHLTKEAVELAILCGCMSWFLSDPWQFARLSSLILVFGLLDVACFSIFASVVLAVVGEMADLANDSKNPMLLGLGFLPASLLFAKYRRTFDSKLPKLDS